MQYIDETCQCHIQTKFGEIFFNWIDFYELQTITKDFYFCLICYQLH